MKSFKGYLNEQEEFPVSYLSHDGKHETFASRNMSNKETRDTVNVYLLQATAGAWSNPHAAFQRCAKVLAMHGVQLPKAYFHEVSGGEMVFGITPHGTMHDYNKSMPETDDQVPEHFFYFEYGVNEVGTFECYAEIVDLDSLEELMAEDVEEDNDDTLSEETETTFKMGDKVQRAGFGHGEIVKKHPDHGAIPKVYEKTHHVVRYNSGYYEQVHHRHLKPSKVVD